MIDNGAGTADPEDRSEYVRHDLQRSSRDLELVRQGLQNALAGHVTDATDHFVGELAGTSATGMSSETLLFEASWNGPSGPRSQRLVARVAPSAADVPVFPAYDLPGQFLTISTVARLSDVPVPPPWWCEPDPSVIGSPFFVMGQVDGQVPPDVMPYNFGESWLFHAAPEDQRRVQESSVDVLVRLHDIAEPERHFAHVAGDHRGSTALRRHMARTVEWYEFAARDCGRSQLLEEGLAWLEERWPAHESQAVFCWGDSRIGNIMYRDFEPAAVLDWEMAGLAPPETDVAWMIYLHRMFEDMAAQYGFPGMAHFLRRDDVAAYYERRSGRTLRDLDWYIVYAAVQFGIVGLRTGQRSVHFGERDVPADPDELVMNAPALSTMIAH